MQHNIDGENSEDILSRKSFIQYGVKVLLAHAVDSMPDLLAFSSLKEGRLKPPGALPDGSFQSRCIPFCDACRNVCPRDSIFQDALGLPYIEPEVSPCVMCLDVSCTNACPTGALTRLTDWHEIRIGIAIIDKDICTAYKGAACNTCYAKCPLQNEAINMAESLPVIDFEACTGCGVCVYECPTPKAITIKQI